jgi:hypothetical protein
MLIKIDGTDTVAAGAAALALVAALIAKFHPDERDALIKLAEANVGLAPDPHQPTNGQLRARI